ncbi:DUF1501 domain-containing protein [Kineosporia rhizophila]|uniref:DUF1501 domain-containing protein n=1 Tax=Kineosporia rhizophila TaxID=84633 RepID=UPI001E4DC5A2|nr:DUF1501 domain-containing protein [Kineosporia rhizophila]MCE0534232.1 DUF1501 domain-containing protein [Kineosporia rhizophila]
MSTLSDCQCPDAASTGLSRRSLLRGLATAGALGGVMTAVDGFNAQFAFAASPAAYTGDVLVVLSLRGGFDGLNAVVPIGDPAYLEARPTIGVPERSLIPAGGIFGLHPALAPLKKFWDAGTFGAVHAVGQDNPTRSHFQAMQELERAAPGSSLRTGWLDRTLGSRARGTIFQASQVGSNEVPLALAGPSAEMAMGSLDSFTIAGAWDTAERKRWTKALTAMNAGAPASIAAPAQATLGATSTTAALAAAKYTPAGGARYPKDSALGKALRDVARMIKADVGLQVACVDEGDWDMHANMGSADSGWMHDHLNDLAQALAAFATDLGSRFRKVTVVTLSEFGRRVVENGSGGVDHGHGNAVLLLGGGVNGGRVHGRWPGLADGDLVDGDLAGTTDYRAILGEILQKRCGAGSLSQIFPGLQGVSPLGVMKAA